MTIEKVEGFEGVFGVGDLGFSVLEKEGRICFKIYCFSILLQGWP